MAEVLSHFERLRQVRCGKRFARYPRGLDTNRAMSKQDNNAPGRYNASQFNMTTYPSVGRFSNDQTASLHVKGSSAKFNDNDRNKTLAPQSNHGQHSQQPSQRPAGSDIVDLRTAPNADMKVCNKFLSVPFIFPLAPLIPASSP